MSGVCTLNRSWQIGATGRDHIVTQPNVAGGHVREVATESVALPDSGTGERSERRRAHRRHARELLLTLLVLFAMLVVTVVVLLGKWMDGTSSDQPGQPVQSGAPSRAARTVIVAGWA